MDVTGLTMPLKFEVMMFEIGETMAHILFTRLHALRPDGVCAALDPNFACNCLECRPDDQLGSQTTGS